MENASEAQFPAVTIRVNDLSKWIAVVVAMANASKRKMDYEGNTILGPNWLYRGQANSDWVISSSFEREILLESSEKLKQDEKSLYCIEKCAMLNFQRWAELPNKQLTRGELLALMQHHGVPTRLVDFTEVPLIALGFALEDKSQEEFKFAVWAVLRDSFNCEYARENIMRGICDGKRRIEQYDDLRFRAFAEEYDRELFEKILREEDGSPPSPLLLQYNPVGMNQRQKLQRGLFLTSSHLHENFMPLLHKWTDTSASDFKNTEPDFLVGDMLSEDGTFIDKVASAHIVKFVFDEALRKDAHVLLECCNIGPRTRYGDNDRVAAETKEMMKEYL